MSQFYTHEEIKAAGLDDVRVFAAQCMDYLRLPPLSPAQLDILSYLQHGPRRKIVCAWRGVGKSYLLIFYALWRLFIDGEEKILVVTASSDLATLVTTFMKQLIYGMPLLQHLIPQQNQRSSTVAFDVGTARESRDPSVRALGIGSSLPGARATLIMADDCEVPTNSFTPHLREKLREKVKEFDSILKPTAGDHFEPGVVFLGTPQVEESLYHKLAELKLESGERVYEMKIWPAELPKKLDDYGPGGERLAPIVHRMLARGWKIGDPLWPERFPKTDLIERRASLQSTYDLQFMLNVIPSEREARPLRCSDLLIHDVDDDLGHVKLVWSSDRDYVLDLACGGFDGDCYRKAAYKSPEMAKWSGTVLAIDPSGRGKDETAIAIIRVLHGTLYLVHVAGYQDGFGEDTLKSIAGKALRYKVNHIICEENFGGGMFAQLLKPYLVAVGLEKDSDGNRLDGRKEGERPLPAGKIDETWNGWSTGNKTQRILDVMEPVVRNHRLVVDKSVVEEDLEQQREKQAYSFIYQLSRIQRGIPGGGLIHEDRLEAVSMGVSYFINQMDRSPDRAVERHNQKILEEEHRKFLMEAGLFGSQNKYKQWLKV